MESTFNSYAAIVGSSCLSFGVAPGKTQAAIVPQLAAWEPSSPPKGGMMEFNINADAVETPAYPMLNAILDNLTAAT